MSPRSPKASVSTDVARIAPPPPARKPGPVFVTLSQGATIVRIFDPDRRGANALTFRHNGPRKRFDHHRGEGSERIPADDPDRAVYYAAWSRKPAEAFSSALVEVFGDTGIVELANRVVAMPCATRSLHLLDLRGRGAVRADTIAAVAKCPYQHSQPWSRYFYDTSTTYSTLDGVLYRNAHNDEPALMLYERAMDGLQCDREAVIRLDHSSLRPLLLEMMRANNLTF